MKFVLYYVWRKIYKTNRRTKEKSNMEPKKYTLIKIEGEYATLKDDKSGEELFIAMALLPPNVDIGTRLEYEFPDFTVL